LPLGRRHRTCAEAVADPLADVTNLT